MTGGIRIPIIADVSGAKKAVDDLGQSAKDAFSHVGDSKGVDYLVDGLGNAVKNAKKLEDVLGDIGKKSAGTGNKSSTDAGKTAAADAKRISDAKKLTDELVKQERLRALLAKHGHSMSGGQAGEAGKDWDFHLKNNASASMRKRFGGMSMESALNGGWRSLGNTEAHARRQMNDMMRHVGLGPMAQQAPAQQSFAAFMRTAMGGAGSTILGSTGFAGSIAQSAVAQAGGGAGGLASGAGMARLLAGGGLALGAYGIAKGIGAAKAKIGSAEEENTSYSDMLRQMGSTTSSFETLRESVRDVSKNLDLSFGDGSKMASTYLHTGGLDGISSVDLGNELRTSGQFSRMLGVDPEQGAGFFGTMRNTKVSGGDGDNKRLAAMIGEAIARAGVFSKSDEVLSAVANYTKIATSAAMSPANTEGYVGAMGNLLNSHSAGLDPSGAANMLGTVDNGFRHPGGEAQRNFLLGSMQRAMPGMTAVDMGFMQDAGMFARASDVFKKGNPAYDAADPDTQAHYDKLAKQGGNKTAFSMAWDNLSGMSTDMQRKSIMGLAPGLTDSAAARLQRAAKTTGGDISETISGIGSRYGVDTSKLSPAALSNMLDVEYGDPSKLKDKAEWFKTQGISGDDRKDLDKALAAPGEGNMNLKDVLGRLSASSTMQMTDGDVSRKNMAALENLSSEVATKLIPMTNAIREGISAIASTWVGGHFKDSFANSDKAGTALDTALKGVKPDDVMGRVNVFAKEADRIRGHENEYTEQYRNKVAIGAAAASQAIDPTPTTESGADATAPIAKGKAAFLKQTRHAAELAAAQMGGKIKPEWLQAQWGLETGWGASVIKGTNNLGNIKGGKGPLVSTTEQHSDGSVYKAKAHFRSYANLDEFGKDAGNVMSSWRYYGVRHAQTKEEFASEMGDSGYASDVHYGSKMLDAINSVESFGATKLPAGASAVPKAAAAGPSAIEGTFYLRDPRTGAQIADPVRASTGGAPSPQGARQ